MILISCEDETTCCLVRQDLIEIVNETTINGESNFIEKQSVNVYFNSQTSGSSVDSVLINGKKLIEKSINNFKLDESIIITGDIDFKVYNYLNQNIDTIIQRNESIKFLNLNSGDTISKSNLPDVRFNYEEYGIYRYVITTDLDPDDPNYVVESYAFYDDNEGEITWSEKSFNKFPSNNYYIIALEASKSKSIYLDFTGIHYNSKYVYYIKFYLTD